MIISVDSKSRNFNWSEFLAPAGAKTGYCLGVENFDIKLAFRLGNRKEGVNKPLKVILDSKKTRTDIINNAKFIVNKAPERFKRVVISKGSYTVSERIQQQQQQKKKKRRIQD